MENNPYTQIPAADRQAIKGFIDATLKSVGYQALGDGFRIAAQIEQADHAEKAKQSPATAPELK